MPASVFDVFRAQLHATIYWYKNNKWMLFSMFIWPYLMVGMLFALGSIIGDVNVYSQRMGIANPALFLLSASVVAMSSISIVDAVAGFALYNRWLGTLSYIVLSPIKTPKLFIAAGIPESLISATITISAVAPAAIYFEGLVGGLKLLLVLAVIVAGMIPMLGLSVIAASLLLVVKEESNIINSLIPFILLVSGVFYPIAVLPSFLQSVSQAIPTKYVVDAAKLVARFQSPSGAAILSFFYILAIMGIAYNMMALLAIGKAHEAVKRKGVD